MSRDIKRPARKGTKAGPSGRDAPLPQFVPPQLSQPVEKPPSGPQWVHEIKLDGFRMAARIDNGRVQLLTRTGLDWTNKYPSAIAALANMRVKTAYIGVRTRKCTLCPSRANESATHTRVGSIHGDFAFARAS